MNIYSNFIKHLLRSVSCWAGSLSCRRRSPGGRTTSLSWITRSTHSTRTSALWLKSWSSRAKRCSRSAARPISRSGMTVTETQHNTKQNSNEWLFPLSLSVFCVWDLVFVCIWNIHGHAVGFCILVSLTCTSTTKEAQTRVFTTQFVLIHCNLATKLLNIFPMNSEWWSLSSFSLPPFFVITTYDMVVFSCSG